MMKTRNTVLGLILVALSPATPGCQSGSVTPGSVAVREEKPVLDWGGMFDRCPGHPAENKGMDGSDYVPGAVSTNSYCVTWLAQTEVHLCAAYFFFHEATHLTAGTQLTDDWPYRLENFRAAIENLMDVVFETDGAEAAGWGRLLVESKVVEKCQDDAEKALVYQRRLKVQAIELYRTLGKYYVTVQALRPQLA